MQNNYIYRYTFVADHKLAITIKLCGSAPNTMQQVLHAFSTELITTSYLCRIIIDVRRIMYCNLYDQIHTYM